MIEKNSIAPLDDGDRAISSVHSSLALRGLRLKVRLGCHADERAIPQSVRFDVQIRFPKLPGGCFSDDLDETICYARISDQIRILCLNHEYRLVEKLGWTVFSTLKENLPPHLKLWIRIIKENPPVADLTEGTSFTVSDPEMGMGIEKP